MKGDWGKGSRAVEREKVSWKREQGSGAGKGSMKGEWDILNKCNKISITVA